MTTLAKGARVQLGPPFDCKAEIEDWVTGSDLATLVHVILLRADGTPIRTHQGRRRQKAWVPLHEIEGVVK